GPRSGGCPWRRWCSPCRLLVHGRRVDRLLVDGLLGHGDALLGVLRRRARDELGPELAARLRREQARHLVPTAVDTLRGRRELRVDTLVGVAHVRAARMERAARRLEDERRRAPLDRDERLVARQVEARD